MEILSPVGGKEQLIAAVRSGANAVYLGLRNFNARRNAENFDINDLIQAVKYCHARDVKVYVTFNTLIKDTEILAAAKEITEIAKAGADALIVQDLGVYSLAKTLVPEMPLHASTQMSIHNPSGVKAIEKLGFSRVVPARELSISELKEIRNNTDIELEVFIHGALCMCVSGQCYLSGILGQRSANRGMCAQPCRLDFKSKNGGHALSLKDLSVIDKLRELESAGIDSAKIEGRMKRPEYVAAATAACALSLAGKKYDKDTLRAVFARSGFTDGYLTGNRNPDMFGYRTKEDVTSAAGVLKAIANSYKNEVPLIGVEMSISIQSGKNIELTVTDGKNTVKVKGDVPEKAINKATDERIAARALEKCGGTQFYTNKIHCDIESGLSVPVSKLNALRKEALEKLNEKRSVKTCYNVYSLPEKLNKKDVQPTLNVQKIYARFEYEQQITDNVDIIIFDYEKLYKNSLLIEKYRSKLIAELPALMFDQSGAKDKLLKLKELGIKKVYAPNLYAVELAKSTGFEIMGGYGLNILNSLSLEQYKNLGLDIAELSFENTLEGFDRINKCIPCGLIVYGKMPLMTFRNCPAKSKHGCGDCKCKATILDRYNNEITILCKDRKYGRLLNPQPIYMGDKKTQLKNADFLTLYFTDETQKDCIKIINKIKCGESFDQPFTRGLYYKEIK